MEADFADVDEVFEGLVEGAFEFFVEGEGADAAGGGDIEGGDDASLDDLAVEEREAVGEFDVGVFFAGEDLDVGTLLEPAPVVFEAFLEDPDIDARDEVEVDIVVTAVLLDPEAEGCLEGGPGGRFDAGAIAEEDEGWTGGGGGLGAGLGRLG